MLLHGRQGMKCSWHPLRHVHFAHEWHQHSRGLVDLKSAVITDQALTGAA